ncbi:actin-binding LIM protein 2-like protein [Leptotrombidium deliense]|uniref:Actin-binding LIM protein 2-like protein n=1 Tax=Leptotrombidium deliense TaxID=299467 RepID=A0A443S9V5_9ACAR|nr:actin-binding LIM protein 2-like protein [Leptotrombidium deliense]
MHKIACRSSLAQGGFFMKDGKYYCTNDYQKLFGTKCAGCGRYVEGEVVTALGKTYHQKCFVCARCRQPFPAGDKVTYTGKECVCFRCLEIPIVTSKSPEGLLHSERCPKCAGCEEEIQEGQALVALDQQWHVWCFRCTTCKIVLHGEYMGKEGLPYCERDYQKQFGVKCAHCDRYITGKVLQAGDNHHFHPTCARCTKCGDPFGDGEEMYMQGGAIWHPRCGPGPDARVEDNFIDGVDSQLYASLNRSPSLSSSLSRSPSVSPYGSLHYQNQYERRSPGILEREPIFNDLSRVYTYGYLTAEPTLGYLRRPVEPYPPKSPQFHRPPDGICKRRTFTKFAPKHGMQVLVDNLQYSQPRPRSPHMNNEEPIELSHYPGAQKPKPEDIPRIERDDFPAPPFPYTDPERRRRWSGSSREQEMDDVDGDEEKREKLRAWKKANVDPRNSSRTPNAKSEVPKRLRYTNPVNAYRPKPWEDDEFDRGSIFRSSGGKASFITPPLNYNVSSLRSVPKPGYGLKSGYSRDGHLNGEDSLYNKLEKTHSIDFSSGKSDSNFHTLRTGKRKKLHCEFAKPLKYCTLLYLNHSISGNFRSTPYSEGFGGYRHASYSPHLRRSMPNVNLHLHSNEPPKLYPYHLLVTSNYRLPPDVDRCHLERHLSNEEFSVLFHMTRLEFYRLPEWRRSELKRRARLF